MFSRIKGWLIAAGAGALAIMAAIGMATRRARQDGVNQVLTEQQERRDELQKHYDQIDSRPPDFDGAIGRLRDRSSRSKR